MTVTKTVGSGNYTYDMVEDWQRLPEGWEMPAAAVAVDSHDNVYCYNRAPEHPVVVFDRDGNYLYSWDYGQPEFPHSIMIGGDDDVWLVDRNRGQVMKFTSRGELLMTLGASGFRSDTGVAPDDFRSECYKDVVRAGGPFNLPTAVALGAGGEIYVSDGYANCRVHQFTPKGELVRSWGEPGDGHSQFHLPHGITVDSRGRLLVADRENDRVQVFTQGGEFVAAWPTHLVGPAVFHVDTDGVVFVAEHNGGLVSVLGPDGERLAQWGSLAHQFCHGIAGDSRGDLYVVQKGDWGRVRRVVKFIRHA